MYDQGASANDLCLEHGISAATVYNKKSKYGGLVNCPHTFQQELYDDNCYIEV